MLKLYQFLTHRSDALLSRYLDWRLSRGKEIEGRVSEKRGIITVPRPQGKILWLHAASVGEVQSALILMRSILQSAPELHVLITTGTRTSAEFLESRLPERCIHQFYPLDNPKWVKSFLDHWKPDLAIWMESELWPNMLTAMKWRSIPAILMNARMSDYSFRSWRWMKKGSHKLLSTFDLVCAQSAEAAAKYKTLGAENVVTCGNLKYSAAPLPYIEDDLKALAVAIYNRPVWLYAQTHIGEEALACKVHEILKTKFPDILTIIVPRHPERGTTIQALCEEGGLDAVRRRDIRRLPDLDTDIYIADTMGELGLFYRLSPLTVIGRCFSADGGGGHNPIEASQLGCAVLSGPDVEHFRDVFNLMWEENAAIRVDGPLALAGCVQELLMNTAKLEALRVQGRKFAEDQRGVVERVMQAIAPQLERLGASHETLSQSVRVQEVAPQNEPEEVEEIEMGEVDLTGWDISGNGRGGGHAS